MSSPATWEYRRELLQTLVKQLLLHGLLRLSAALRLTKALLSGDTDALFSVLEEVLISTVHSNDAAGVLIRERKIQANDAAYMNGSFDHPLEDEIWSRLESLRHTFFN